MRYFPLAILVARRPSAVMICFGPLGRSAFGSSRVPASAYSWEMANVTTRPLVTARRESSDLSYAFRHRRVFP